MNFAKGQYNDLRFQRYSVVDGISQGYINTIVQDDKGFIWFGTHKGINRFDGYNFSIYLSRSDDPASRESHMITKIFVDSKNRLWATSGSGEGGLFLYNRDQDKFIKIIPHSDLIIHPKDNRIFDVVEDMSGNLLLSTHFGIRVFNPEIKDQKILPNAINVADTSSWISLPIGKIFIDSKNWLWIGTSSGLHLSDAADDCLIDFKYDKENPFSIGNNQITDIIEDPFGTIWVGTREGGLNKVVIRKEGVPSNDNVLFIRYLNEPSDPGSIPNNIINAFNCDASGNLWIGTDDGICKLNRSALLKSSNELQSSLEFQCYETNPLDNESLNYNFVQSVFNDRSGTLWVGTSTGLNKQKKYKFQVYKQDITEESLASNKVQTIFEDRKGKIWIGSSKGLNQFNMQDNNFLLILRGAILGICEDMEGYLWIAQWHKGLMQFDPVTGEKVSYITDVNDPGSVGANHIFTVLTDRKNNVWIGTWGGGLNLFNRKDRNFTRFINSPDDNSSLSDDYIYSIFEDSEGVLWVGTLNGLNQMTSRETGTFISYRHDANDPLSISNNAINCIYESENGTMWIGTQEGLNRFSRSEQTFTSYTRADGLTDDAIMGILEDEHGDLWTSTSKGLSKIKISQVEEPDMEEYDNTGYTLIQSSVPNDPVILFVKNFDVDDGLQSREFLARSCLKTRSGEMLFGGINGFNMFHPDSVKDNMYQPEVIFTSLQLFNKDISIGQVVNGDTILRKSITEASEIKLSHRNNVFSIEFAAMDFVAPEQNQFAYKLEGFEQQWNFSYERKASYTNLNPGEYFFSVKASNNDGIWSEKVSVLKIIIAPPFWKTWWFKTLFIAMVIAFTLMAIEVRLYAVKKQKKILEEKVIERTAQIVIQKDQIEKQADKIKQMNEVLEKHNIELEDNLQYLSEARVMQKLIGFDEFRNIYPDESSCCLFLEEMKWKDGYTCKKCGNHDYGKDDVTLMRRCKKCNYKESVTCGTIFHRLRFPIDKAFYILILTSTGREINISQLSQTIDLRMKTCWEFHNKVKKIMQTRSRFKNPKEGWKELILLAKKKSKIT